eukprot:SAG11_NODE_33165_length_278_cov_313.631285_1_plen_29_part_10
MSLKEYLKLQMEENGVSEEALRYYVSEVL